MDSLIFSALATFAFSGFLCGLGSGLGSEAHAQTTKPLEKLTMRLDWKPAGQHALFYFAKDKGFYSQEGIDLTLIPGSGSADSLKQIGARSVDLGIVDALVLSQGIAQKVPLRSVAVYFQSTAFALISPKAKPITEVKQLTSGVKVGRRKASGTYQGLLALLAIHGIQPEQVNMVDIGFGVQPLVLKQVDVIAGISTDDPVEIEAAGMPVHELFIADHGVNVYGFTIAVNEDVIAKRGATITRFLRATRKAMQELPAQKQAAVQAVLKAAPELDLKREMKVLDNSLRFVASKDTAAPGFGWQTEQRWQATADTARKLGLIDRNLAAKDMFTNEFLK
jgi:NitT/TauT family transport system substrate-binding protein